MIVVNLEKYSDDGFKQSANSLIAAGPDVVTHARLYYDSFAGVDFIQGAFVNGNNSTVEFDPAGVTFTKFKLFTSTDGTNYTERKTYGGTDGRDELNESFAIDPADFADNQIIVKTTISTIEQFIPIDIDDLLFNIGYASSVNYLLRGKLVQDNSVQSGKAFFGTYTVNPDDGTLIDGTNSNYGNDNRYMSIATRARRVNSEKVSTGIYSVQFQISSDGIVYINGFVAGVNGTANRLSFFPYVQPVYGKYISGKRIELSSLKSVLEVQRFSATHVRIKLSGVSDHVAYLGIATEIFVSDLVCDLLPIPLGYYTVSSVATTYIDILCNTTSGTGSFVSATGILYYAEDGTTFQDNYIDELKGYLVLDVNHAFETYYDVGKLIFKTYNTSWVLTDDIINRGVNINIMFPIGGI